MTFRLPPITAATVVLLLHIHTRAPLSANGFVHHQTKLCRNGTRQWRRRRQQQQPPPPTERRLWSSPNTAATHQAHAIATGSSLSLSLSATANNLIDEISKDVTTLSTALSSSSEAAAAQRTALSMTIDELSLALGGRGRARIAWDCYVEGVDPQYLFHPSFCSSSNPSSFGGGSSSRTTIPIEYQHPEQLKKQILPTPRQTQPLGSSALTSLFDMHVNCTNNGQIENGLATLVHVSSSSDGTTKLLLRLVDGLEVETVLIPFWNDVDDNNDDDSANNNRGRTTVCISSQVGCKQGCRFCATGKMGKIRSLTADEILVQLFFAKKIVRLSGGSIAIRGADFDDDDDGLPSAQTSPTPPTTKMQHLPKISNIVFMGMGDSADNASAVRHAIDIMTQNELFQLSANRVTVSTVAPTPQSFAEFANSRCVLAWSVHAARDELRRQLVPTTRYTMNELRDGLIQTLQNRRLRTCMIEVALMDGVNDSIREAEEMSEFISYISNAVPGSKLVCNLIPYNDIGVAAGTTTATTLGNNFRKPSMERVSAYQQRLQAARIQVHVRGTRGDDESAACGQLVTSRKKKPIVATEA